MYQFMRVLSSVNNTIYNVGGGEIYPVSLEAILIAEVGIGNIKL